MVLLLSLLLAVGWLITAFALPQETIKAGTVVARALNDTHSSDTPTLTPQVLRQDVLGSSSQAGFCNYDALPDDTAHKDTETAHFESTETALLRSGKRGVDKEPLGKENRCIFAKEKVPSANGCASWETSDDHDSSQHDCKEYCSTHSGKTQDKIRSTSCFKNDGKPWTDEKGNEPSGP